MFYRIINDKLADYRDTKYTSDCLYTDIITQNELDRHPNKVIVEDGVLVLNPDYEQEEEEKEKQRIAMLHLTRGDVFRALLLAKGVTRTQLRAIIENLPDETNEQAITKEMALIDFDEALDFYRGNSLIDTVGEQLGITSEQMTKFFETNDWHELVTPEEEEDDLQTQD